MDDGGLMVKLDKPFTGRIEGWGLGLINFKRIPKLKGNKMRDVRIVLKRVLGRVR